MHTQYLERALRTAKVCGDGPGVFPKEVTCELTLEECLKGSAPSEEVEGEAGQV